MSKDFKNRIPPLLESLKKRLEERNEHLDSGCIIYTGQNNGTYGQIEYRRKTYLAHRASYMVYKGEIPKGKCICHLCDVPLCINPDHLWLGTYKENVSDMIAKKRQKYNPVKKLTDTEVMLIHEELSNGAKQKYVAEKFGVSQSYISMLHNGARRHAFSTSFADSYKASLSE